MSLISILIMMKNRCLRDGLFTAAFRGSLTKGFAGRKASVNKPQGLMDRRSGAISKNLRNVPAADVCHALDGSCSRIGVTL